MVSDGNGAPVGSGGSEVVARLAVFEKYDRPLFLTDDGGIATFEGGAEVVYFEGPDANTLSLAEVGGRNPTEEDR